ncbi:hypothetical protein CU098_005267 [Rhizopus stolonifer]|uniref:C2H2-type domain-containing protein n=2 Tax=Mucorineae TaxID=1344963 RepID=A0A367JAG3_RHIST|nr:hypothetical protein CU098_005267 [Rhizopus stolonifer]
MGWEGNRKSEDNVRTREPIVFAPEPLHPPRPPHNRSFSDCSFDKQPTTILHRRAASDISSHVAITNNSSNNRYRCNQCQKTFSRPSSLRIHILSHTGEKPHVCPQPGCGKRFSVQSNMRRHLKVHYCNP